MTTAEDVMLSRNARNELTDKELEWWLSRSGPCPVDPSRAFAEGDHPSACGEVGRIEKCNSFFSYISQAGIWETFATA
jgi:hypothetical protein